MRHDPLTRQDEPHEVTVSFEYDDPDADTALAAARQYRLDGIDGLTRVWIEQSTESEDDTVPGDQHHEVRAVVMVSAPDARAAARWVTDQMRRIAPHDDNLAICVDGSWSWLSDQDWDSQYDTVRA